ncbi:MAG TPA: prepilin-type N-terminal cleavage/methylation domain-containing protein [Dongiaceae bacterium]|jgi:general secretion pathway protein G|nr:prepilin-type N-terminal cleavage/methylation domain-containing protein [Dongiaceae bacterium]
MRTTATDRRAGFSLIELVIVVVIIGIIAAIAIPRLSRGSAGAADSALSGNLAVLRNAIDLYATEHGGTYPALATFDTQLTQYTDSSGTPSATKTATAIYGPYLRKVPPLPVGANKNSVVVVDGSSGSAGAGAGAWFYNATTGDLKANCPDAEVDASGKKYNTY